MDIKKAVTDQFGKGANAYVNSTIHKDGKDLQQMLAMATLSGEEVVLDIATGGGHTANAFAPFVKKVIAADLTPEMLAAAEKFITGNGIKNVEFKIGDAENLPFPDEFFDMVTCRIAPHHFPNVNQFVSEVNRVLKPNGQFLLDDNVVPEDDEFDHFYNTVEKKRDYSHFRAWKKTEWIRMLEMTGFEIYEWHRFVKTFRFETWCNNMKLSETERVQLSEYMISSSHQIKHKFKIVSENERVISFQGEAIVVKAVKE